MHQIQQFQSFALRFTSWWRQVHYYTPIIFYLLATFLITQCFLLSALWGHKSQFSHSSQTSVNHSLAPFQTMLSLLCLSLCPSSTNINRAQAWQLQQESSSPRHAQHRSQPDCLSDYRYNSPLAFLCSAFSQPHPVSDCVLARHGTNLCNLNFIFCSSRSFWIETHSPQQNHYWLSSHSLVFTLNSVTNLSTITL
jgi:hypothetical protein